MLLCEEMALSYKVLIDTDYWINCLFSPNVLSSAWIRLLVLGLKVISFFGIKKYVFWQETWHNNS